MNLFESLKSHPKPPIMELLDPHDRRRLGWGAALLLNSPTRSSACCRPRYSMHYRAAFNEEFAVPAAESGTAFVPFLGPGLADILCEHHERTVSRDNCVSFEDKRLQIPAQAHRCHFIKAPWYTVTPTGAWRCSTGRASSPSTSPTAPWWRTCAPRRPVPQWLAKRPRCAALDLGFVPLSVSGAGLPAWTTRYAPARSRCRPPLSRGQALRRGSLCSPRLRLARSCNPDGPHRK